MSFLLLYTEIFFSARSLIATRYSLSLNTDKNSFRTVPSLQLFSIDFSCKYSLFNPSMVVLTLSHNEHLMLASCKAYSVWCSLSLKVMFSWKSLSFFYEVRMLSLSMLILSWMLSSLLLCYWMEEDSWEELLRGIGDWIFICNWLEFYIFDEAYYDMLRCTLACIIYIWTLSMTLIFMICDPY